MSANAPAQPWCVGPLRKLSEELLVLVVEKLDRGSITKIRLTCTKLARVSEPALFKELIICLGEDDAASWKDKLQSTPQGIATSKHLTILNLSLRKDGYFHRATICRPYSYRILRWDFLTNAADTHNRAFAQAALFRGNLSNWKLRLSKDQLQSFRWRHATPLDLPLMIKEILLKNNNSLENVEVSMFTPPSAYMCKIFASQIKDLDFPKLKTLVYNGLSHTEPLIVNGVEKGGRFRMLRPLFRKVCDDLRELELSQDHCISQIGKTPLINGRTYHDFLCDLSEIYTHPDDLCNPSRPSVVLNLDRLSLGGFAVGSLLETSLPPTCHPRVRINLSRLRRLVLNDCHEVATLFRDLAVRDNVRLTEFGFRMSQQEDAIPAAFVSDPSKHWEDIHVALNAFLVSFTGLEVLSVLWCGISPPRNKVISDALTHHFETLQVYSYAVRTKHDEAAMANYQFVQKPFLTGGLWCGLLPPDRSPILREFGLPLPMSLQFENYHVLKLLSQFPTLRTVQIRNFPPLQMFGFLPSDEANDSSIDQSRDPVSLWRTQSGTVSDTALKVAAIFAEHIALPFYGAAPGSGDIIVHTNTIYHLVQLATRHAEERDKKLLAGKLQTFNPTSTPTPIRNLINHVIEQRAKNDARFAELASKIDLKIATAEETKSYWEYVSLVNSTLGICKPDSSTKPNLRLLVIGDWRYRDQLNLTGPRTWDPDAWCTDPLGESSSLPSDNEEDDEEMNDYGTGRYKLRSGFRNEFDVSLLPIFFKIDWVAEQGKLDQKWRWKAKVEALKQTTLEGFAELQDVRGLDFAWQN